MSPATPPPPSENAKRGLAHYRQQLADAKRRDINKALRQLRKTNEPVTVAAVAAKAGVSRNTVYKHKDILATIDRYRQHPTNDAEGTSNPRESTIISALRRKLAACEAENANLKSTVAENNRTIALLYGKLDESGR